MKRKLKQITPYVATPEKTSRLEENSTGRIISFYTSKGGVGKTTLCMNFASVISNEQDRHSSRFKKILLIDMDSQMSLTNLVLNQIEFEHHIIEQEELLNVMASPDNFGEYKYDKKDILSMIKGTDSEYAWGSIVNNLYLWKDINGVSVRLIKGSLDLSIFSYDCGIHRKTNENTGYYSKLRDLLKYLRMNFDLIILDLNPEMSALNYCLLELSDKILMPLMSDSHALTSLTIIKRLFIKNKPLFKEKIIGYVLMKIKQRNVTIGRATKKIITKIRKKIEELKLDFDKLGEIEFFHSLNEEIHDRHLCICDHAYQSGCDNILDSEFEGKRRLQGYLRQFQSVTNKIIEKL